VVKVSAGMAFRIPLVSIGNVNNTIRDLKERRFWIYGLETGSSQKISDEKFDAPAVLVFGNEGAGVREKTLELCDIKLEIPIDPRCESLNVAASAAVALYAWSARRK
jgi:23S rRNA (guanosine2251-2'-O)-methyltransferase